jgi:hypothetical protein
MPHFVSGIDQTPTIGAERDEWQSTSIAQNEDHSTVPKMRSPVNAHLILPLIIRNITKITQSSHYPLRVAPSRPISISII